MDWLPKHEASLTLEHNEHRNYYQPLEEWLIDQGDGTEQCRFDWVSPEEREKAIREDSCWVLHWYPLTPIGFNAIAASSLEAIKEAVVSDSQ